MNSQALDALPLGKIGNSMVCVLCACMCVHVCVCVCIHVCMYVCNYYMVQSNYSFTLSHVIMRVNTWLHGKSCHVAACPMSTSNMVMCPCIAINSTYKAKIVTVSQVL